MTTRRIAVLAGAAAVTLALAGTAVAPSAPGSAFELDLLSRSTGARVASLAGTVGRAGIGYASIVPLSGASAVGMGRGEAAQVRRVDDGRLLVVGGLGTRVLIRPAADHQHAAGVGHLALALGSKKTVRVGAVGTVSDSAFRPRPRQLVIVVGTSSGSIHDAMAKRYRLVTYSPSTYSRAALLRNPSLYKRVAGLLVGNDVSRSALARLDLARSLYNAGRWVATSGSPTALDQHMYVVAHAHLGTVGAMIRRATPALGSTSNDFLQLREPRIAYVRVGQARSIAYAKPKPAQMNAAVSAGAADMQKAMARDETWVGSSVAATATESQTSGPPGGGATGGSAVLNIPVHQSVNINVAAPTVPSILAPNFTCTTSPSPSGGPLNFVPAGLPSPPPSPSQPACPPAVAQQTVNLIYNPVYSVSLQITGENSTWQQTVSETSATTVNAVASPTQTMGAGSTYSVQGQAVLPATWGQIQMWNYTGPGQPFYGSTTANERHSRSENGQIIPGPGPCRPNQACPNQWGVLYGTSQEAGLELAEAVHSVSVACSGCTSTASGANSPVVSVVYEQNQSQPTSQVIQSAANATSGNNWETSTTAQSGWTVGANLGAFGDLPMGGLSGGYNSSTSQTTSKGHSFQLSTGFTLANWATTGTGLPAEGVSPSQAIYTSVSTNIPGAQGSAAYAAQSLNFSPLVSPNVSNTGAYVASPGSQYGAINPGPQCFTASGQGPCLPQYSPPAWGSQMNGENFLQGSVSTFSVDAGAGQLGIGSVLPYTMDNLYLSDQMVNSGYGPTVATSCFNGPNGVQGCGNSAAPWGMGLLTEVQVLNMGQTIAAAQAQPATAGGQALAPEAAAAQSTPTTLASSLTTYYSGKGVVQTGAQGPTSPGVTYTTLGLDLCAPVVLTAELWSAGCSKAPGLSGPPATAQGAGPTITAAKGAITTSAKGQAIANAGTALTCKKGTWSGSPSYAYQWMLWNSSVRGWGNIAGATQAQYTPSVAGYVLCHVTATNSKGSATAGTPSVDVVVPTSG